MLSRVLIVLFVAETRAIRDGVSGSFYAGDADLDARSRAVLSGATRDVDDLPPAAPSYYRQRVAMSRAAGDDPWRGGD